MQGPADWEMAQRQMQAERAQNTINLFMRLKQMGVAEGIDAREWANKMSQQGLSNQLDEGRTRAYEENSKPTPAREPVPTTWDKKYQIGMQKYGDPDKATKYASDPGWDKPVVPKVTPPKTAEPGSKDAKMLAPIISRVNGEVARLSKSALDLPVGTSPEVAQERLDALSALQGELLDYQVQATQGDLPPEARARVQAIVKEFNKPPEKKKEPERAKGVKGWMNVPKIDKDTVAQYKAMYPGKTDAEIVQAMRDTFSA